MKKQNNFWYKYSRNKAAVLGLILFVLIILTVIVFSCILDYDADAITQNIKAKKQFPNAQHWFGTDIYGRDMFARVIFGAWYSFGIGFISVAIAVVFGTMIGTVSAYFGGIVESSLMRFVDIWLAIPSTLMAIVIIAAFGSSVVNLILALAISMIPSFSRISRSAALPVRRSEYIEAAKAVGAGHMQIMLTHILPNSIGPVLVQATLSVSKTILAIAGLGFIGLGISQPAPEWGTLLSEGKNLMQPYPYLIIIPGVAIILLSLAINLIGDGLRDVLDPRAKK